MPYVADFAINEPARVEVDAWSGLTAIEFGAPWCPHCIGAQPLFETALAVRDDIRHIKIEDGPGRPLGRSFRIKLWPTLVLLRDGEELGRVVRPTVQADVDALLAQAG
ncbi:MAG: thioredoxin family protein [Xanthomonadaceae bacterium]|nr:thioredoxin family protein [Xanthomonadaceae bacterium]